MSPERKRSAKKHFLGTESGFKKLLTITKKDIPSEETIDAIHDYNIRTGKLDPAKLPESASFYLKFLLNAERKSLDGAAGELGIKVQDLKHLKNETTPIDEQSLFKFCGRFVEDHSEFTLRPLFTLLKRALVLYAMASEASAVKKAARKKK